MQYAVVGAGHVGRCLIQDILESDANALILALDIHPESLELVTKLERSGRIKTIRTNAEDIKNLARSIEGSAVVVNTTDGSRCLEIMRASIQALVPYIDVHGTLLVEERFALSERFKQAGVTALIGMGCSPGVTNMLGAYGARCVSGEITIEVEYVTLRPLNPSPGLLETALRQFRSHVRSPVYENGKLEWHLPFNGRLLTEFPGFQQSVELVFTPHSEPITIPRFVPNLKKVTVRGTYHPTVMALLRTLYEFGLLTQESQVEVEGKKVFFQPLLVQALMGNGSEKPSGIDPVYMLRVRVIGEEKLGKQTIQFTVGHPRGWDPLPQARMTSLPTSYTAQLVAAGELKYPGVCGPEIFTDKQVKACLNYLEKRGLWVETITEKRLVSSNTP